MKSRAQFNADPALRAEFAGSFEVYAAYQNAALTGRLVMAEVGRTIPLVTARQLEAAGEQIREFDRQRAAFSAAGSRRLAAQRIAAAQARQARASAPPASPAAPPPPPRKPGPPRPPTHVPLGNGTIRGRIFGKPPGR